ncbi:Protein-S-isoprenylcysteine O-methyltransferase Ste14 [Shimia gijangensis]|uniref:Protein-S-isoprenylcysteine O-methyltransferase Ste14 n=1 Tax=Shimia gijangensis TaxID=1470563 RepID=A0A1M6L1P4_9RHOB|nr:isoprenylcysteine carboxylmethyltransferase family protein [Shimia gijangensis]SHJ65032.1 Protein-S-isoprenylcysteine O-methyltransferase Ste14 [Shimia gijangensis]
MTRWLDIPPVWLACCLALAWCQAAFFPLGLSLGGIGADFVGGILVGGGVILIALAASEMRRQKTTIIPHQDADRLVQSGIFSRSRNPIYLGDALILLGLILYWDAVLSLPLVPVFVWIIEKRFVIPEENRLRIKFRANFARYCEKVRRWV